MYKRQLLHLGERVGAGVGPVGRVEHGPVSYTHLAAVEGGGFDLAGLVGQDDGDLMVVVEVLALKVERKQGHGRVSPLVNRFSSLF